MLGCPKKETEAILSSNRQDLCNLEKEKDEKVVEKICFDLCLVEHDLQV